MVTILAAPGWSVLGVFGIVLLLLGRKKKPLIGYVRP
jgi:membrane-bound ClpP family serine protease